MNPTPKPNFLPPRWSKVFSDLWEDKTRTGLVVASIATGVFAVGMIISTFVIMHEDFNRSYAAVNPPNIEVVTDAFDDDLVRTMAKVPGVADVEGRRILTVRARRGAEAWIDLTLVGMKNLEGHISLRTPIEGVGVAGKDEAVISQDILHVSGLHAGDVIEVALPGGRSHFLTVVGLVADQTTSKPDPAAYNLMFVDDKTLQSLGLGDTYTALYFTVKGGGGDREFISSVAAAVKDKVKDSGRTAYRVEQHLSTEQPMADITLIIIGVLGALGGLIAILSSSLIINTLNALLAQQLRQIGVMKLVGARQVQIMGMYLLLVIAYGAIALILAIPLGAVAGYELAWFMAYLTGAVIGSFRFIPIAVIAQALIAILIPLGAGFFPVNNGAKTSVQAAVSNYRPGGQPARHNLLNASGFAWVSRPILLSFRNTFRKRGRLLLTIFTLTIAGAVFIAVFNVRDSLGHVVESLLQHYLGDVTVDFSRSYRVDEIRHTLLEIPGVEGVEGWTGAAGEIWDENDDFVSRLSIIAPPQDTQLLNLKLVAGRWLLPNEERAIVVSDSLYLTYPGLKPGDQIIIKLPGRPKEPWTVVGVFPFLALFGDPMAYANYDFIAAQNYQPNQAASYRIITHLHDAESNRELTGRIDTYLTERKFAVQSVNSGSELRQKATIAINVVIVFLLIMAILTAFVGSIGLTGAMSINVLERTREIGVMRTIGAVDQVIMQSVIIEALIIGLITWVLAIGVSFPIGNLLLTIIGKTLGTPMALDFTPLGILLWLVVVIALSIFASIMPARNAARLTINEVLAYE